jgi:hypothetical protein
MTHGFEFEGYERYLSQLHADAGLVPVQSLDDARSRWSVRQLSRSEFDALMDSTSRGSGVWERWLTRVKQGYDREKSALADEIEDLFAHVPFADQVTTPSEDAA